MAQSLYEQETIINYNREEKTASVYTEDPVMIRKLDALCEKSEAITVVLKEERRREYIIPKSWVKIKMPRILTDEQKQKLTERMKKLRKDTNDGMD